MAAGAVCVYAWWVAGLEHFTTAALLAVGAGGLATVLWASRNRRPRPRQRLTRVGVAVWAVLLSALAGWELLAYSSSPRSSHPTLSSIADAALRHRPVEAAAFVAWLCLGWRLAGR